MKAIIIEGPYNLSLQEIPYPEPKAGEVTIKVKNAGICGTDHHIFQGKSGLKFPIVPGHEFSGTIYELGIGVTDFKVGDRVAVDPSVSCGQCKYCLSKRGNLCPDFGGIGTTLQGSMAEYVAVQTKKVIKIPDTMSFEEAAFIEPVACVVHAMDRLNLKLGDNVILFGAGAMGLQLIQALSKMGASELVVVDVSAKKLNIALELGATKGILSKDVNNELKRKDYPYGFDVVIDATGISKVIQDSINFMGPGSKFLQFGVTGPNDKLTINSFDLYNNDWTIIGSMALNYTYLSAYKWIKENRISLTPLISNLLSIEETVEFFQEVKDPDLLKVQIKF